MNEKNALFILLLCCMFLPTLAQHQKDVVIPIIQSSDDMEEWIGGKYIHETDYNSSDLELGSEKADGSRPQLVAVRFQNLRVPRNRKVSNVRIEFVLDNTRKTADPFNVRIWAEDADSTSTFNASESIKKEVSSRKRLAENITWTIPKGAFNTVGERYATADITSLLQKLVNREKWKPGNAVTFFIEGSGTREVESYEGSPADAATLLFSYELTDDEYNNDIDTKAKEVLNELTKNLKEEDYTVPSWTMLLRAITSFNNSYSSGLSKAKTRLAQVIEAMHKSDMPYCINMTINKDTRKNMAFTWYTNAKKVPGKVQIIKGKNVTEAAFLNPTFTFDADTLDINSTNYSTNRNGLRIFNIPNNIKKSYTSHKALATGLAENTTYSYRVGNEGAWSNIGTFTTAISKDKNEYSFIYIADTQAYTDEMFNISAQTIAAAQQKVSDARFMLVAGDLVESAGRYNSEWEWEQWFQTNNKVISSMPLVPVLGNHDISVNKNFTNHFNIRSADFDQSLSTNPGSIYSFVYGKTLFIVCSAEDYKNEEIMDKLAQYVRQEGNAHPEVRWKIATIHRGLYTGASHQDDSYGKVLRKKLAPVFDEIGVDVVLQGHDHVYEVIGPLRNHKLVPNSISEVKTVSHGGEYENMTGKSGGVFNVKNGTLYFLNNSSGKKKYYPRTKQRMENDFYKHHVSDYWSLFTGKFSQTGKPTFSDMKITDNILTFTTYEVDNEGVATEFDLFQVVKTDDGSNVENINGTDLTIEIAPNPVKNRIFITGGREINKTEIIDMTGKTIRKNFANKRNISVSDLDNGIYLLRVHEEEGNVSTHKIVVEK